MSEVLLARWQFGITLDLSFFLRSLDLGVVGAGGNHGGDVCPDR